MNLQNESKSNHNYNIKQFHSVRKYREFNMAKANKLTIKLFYESDNSLTQDKKINPFGETSENRAWPIQNECK